MPYTDDDIASRSTFPKTPSTIAPTPRTTAMHDPLTIAPQEKDTILVQGITRTEDEPGITRLQDGRHTPPAMTETAKSETRVGTPEESKNILAHATDPTEIELPLQPSKEVPALEKLPPELRRYLLSTVELDSLQSLIEASPIYYQQYKLDREQLLCRSLESTLGSAAVDAYYVYQSNTVEFSKHRTPDRIDELLKSYRDRMSQPWCEVLGIKDVVSMIKFYSKIIQPLLRHYKSQALNRLAEETKSPKINEDLSRTEEIRLMRAFYRYQLCCNIYGLGRGKPFRFDEGFRFDEVYCCDDTWAFHTGYVTSARLLGDFFCIFDPWEAEELACITKFVQEKYEAIFDKIQWDLNDKNPKFDGQRPSTPDGAFDLRNFVHRESFLNSLASRGLELLHFFCFKVQGHEQLVSTMQRCITRHPGEFLLGFGSPLRESTQWNRHRNQPGDRDHKQGHRELLTFQGDKQSNGSHVFPPLAWTLVFGGTYSNIFGEYIPEKFQKWGWVMWDAARLERMGAKDVMIDEWEDWGDRREDYWYLE